MKSEISTSHETWEEREVFLEEDNYAAVTEDALEYIEEEKNPEYEALGQLISETVSTDIDISQQPEILQVMHVSRLMALEKEEVKADEVSSPALISEKKFPKVAIIIDDMGASPKRTNEIIALKAPLTASFVTFASQLDKQVKLSRQAGQEIMIHVPMQPKSNIFVSDDVLTIDMSAEEIENNFRTMLKKFDHVAGINNHMGSLFTEHADKLEPVMKVLAENDMFFVDSKTTPQSQGEMVAKKYGVPCLHRHVFLDNENNLEYILSQLEIVEKIAHKNGYAIAIGHPKSETSKALDVWLKTLDAKEIQIVHLSEIIRDQQNHISEEKN